KLAQSLLRTDKLQKFTGGLEISRQTESFEPRWNELTGRSSSRQLWSQKSWLTRAQSDGSQTIMEWCDGKKSGVFTKAFQIDRIRRSVPQDLDWPALDDYSITSLEQSYSAYLPKIEEVEKGRIRLILSHPDTDAETRFLIDNTKNVILAIENRSEG